MRIVIAVFFIFIHFQVLGCSCDRNPIGDNFLNQVKSFDLIAKGTIIANSNNTLSTFFVLEEVYKGNAENDTIQIVAYNLCDISFSGMENGESWVIGFKKQNNHYTIPGCATSTLSIDQNKANGLIRFLPSLLAVIRMKTRNSISLQKLKRKIKRRA